MNRLSTWPLERTLQIIGGRWKLYILFHVLAGPRRLSQLQRGIPGISQKVLVQQLREMEEHGLITRKVFAAAPPHVEYSATELGLSLAPLMDNLQNWGIRHAKATGDHARMVYCDGFAAENRAATAA